MIETLLNALAKEKVALNETQKSQLNEYAKIENKKIEYRNSN